MTIRIINADVLSGLAQLEDESVQMVCTSPPYWGLRDYGVEGQIGLEPTPDEFVQKMVAVFREVKRVLRSDGVLFLNIGDSYNAHPGQRKVTDLAGLKQMTNAGSPGAPSRSVPTLKPKDLVGIPWMTAFALRADGWYLRQEIIWSKPNPMPESVKDRCTKSHEHIFLLSKSAKYYYDADAIREAPTGRTDPIRSFGKVPGRKDGNSEGFALDALVGRNKRSVWTIATQPYSGAHFAVFPEALPDICIKAGSKPGDMILDPFGGSGTTALVADKLGRDAVLIELNPEYVKIAENRIKDNCPLFSSINTEEADNATAQEAIQG